MALLSDERETIMSIIESKVIMEEEKFGIKILDVRIGRTDLTEQVANNVFQRMRSEREKEANLLRAEGEELSTEIRARANRQKTVIIAEAERTSSILRGQGDAQKNTILGNAYEIDNEQSIEFFNIIRKLQACRDTFGNTNMTMVIAPGQICDKFFGEIKQD
jgi:membrane protease subunit HflC